MLQTKKKKMLQPGLKMILTTGRSATSLNNTHSSSSCFRSMNPFNQPKSSFFCWPKLHNIPSQFISCTDALTHPHRYTVLTHTHYCPMSKCFQLKSPQRLHPSIQSQVTKKLETTQCCQEIQLFTTEKASRLCWF